ncbi:MAG: hypothetical protein A3H98_14190 [Bacteroidetes bacterium RIFCSPLOWO2_02_FULL_36_8]|nr:MAG: hypothetical protein A3H98_14190 [Bacteroidetes bacterium RIFCSPLOWO2_02_FULL_36_8]OFY69118.1 MAG: hypothetical protein A3G23_06100 [Bacteroidetes bacterium RIFCSPLOWO2_12_FULL_37_12]
MDKLIIEATDDTPKIILDPEKNLYEFSGRSMPEDAAEFYLPIIQWLKTYKESGFKSIILDFRMEYFNTASSKMIWDILHTLQGFIDDGMKVNVRWFYYKDDLEMEDAANDYSEMFSLPIEKIIL